jgi:hypothetical protein
MLSYEEVTEICNLSLSKLSSDLASIPEDMTLSSLTEYFTKFVFDAVGINYDDEIPLQLIKEVN